MKTHTILIWGKMKSLLLCCLLILVQETAWPAITNFQAIYAFGDSLIATSGGPYWNGRWANGPMGIEFLSTHLGFPYQPANNQAAGGATTAQVFSQVQALSAPAHAASALFVVGLGHADFASLASSTDDMAWSNVFRTAIANISNSVIQCHLKGARTVAYMDIMDPNRMPTWSWLPNKAYAREKALHFNSALHQATVQIEAVCPDLDLIHIDMMSFVDAIVTRPADYGFTKASLGALDDPELADKSYDGPGKDYVFWDASHFTSKTHSLLADLFGLALAVNLPGIQLASPVVNAGSDLHLSLTGVPWPSLTYQWRFQGDEITGATHDTLLLPNVQPHQSGSYSVAVSDGTNQVVARLVILWVLDRPLITTQPQSVATRPGSNVTFQASAISPNPVAYQWQFKGADLDGATHATLTLTNVQPADEGTYTVVVSDTTGSVTSNPAHLWLLINPVILQPPLSQSVVEGGSVTFSIQVDGTLPMSYRWRKGFATVMQEMLHSRLSFLTLTNVPITDNRAHITVVLTNQAFSLPGVLSPAATLTVLADTDADGLPDEWESACGLDPDSADHAAADDDGDGQSNWAEYLAGTDPTNTLSYLKVDTLTLDNGGSAATLRFFAVSNKTYTVQYRESLDSGEWLRLTDVVAASTNRVAEVLDPAPDQGATQRVYRLATPRVP